MFKWVHVSDLHFHNSKRDDLKKMKESLPNELKNIKDVDALFITGDFRFAKDNNEDINEIVEYINTLSKALNINKEQIYCVPGNHDLQRNPVREALIASVRSNTYTPEKGYFEDGILPILSKDFDFFERVLNKLYGSENRFENDEVHKVINSDKCNILLLNTSITACNDDDRQNLVIGSRYLEDALNKLDATKPTIMIGHHGHSFFERGEAKYIQSKLKEHNVAIYLCGHEHALNDESVWDNVRQYTAGCIWVNEACEKDISAGFYIGVMDENNTVNMTAYRFISGKNKWKEDSVDCNSVKLSPLKNQGRNNTESLIVKNELDEKIRKIKSAFPPEQKEYEFKLNGHVLLGGRGKEGIKYYWLKGENRVESIAFNTRLYFPHHDPKKREEDSNISAYTASVSFGCVLSASNSQCRFCETGSRDFRGFLSSEEIALQNIFMATYDADCPSYPEVRQHKREFAFMGQGEPGYNYPAIRRAILLTDRAMEAIGQTVHRYIISTCGVLDFMPQLINDIKSGVFKNRVSLHFSLHAVGDDRKLLMPIEKQFSYVDFIELCKEFYAASKEAFGVDEKIGVGIMMFKDFVPVQPNDGNNLHKFNLMENDLDKILRELDSSIFKIDLCDFNSAPSVTAECGEMKNEDAQKLLKHALDKGFEAKTFSSFGSDKNAGCGMLKSAYVDAVDDGENTLEKFKESLSLLHYASNKLKEDGLL